MMLVPNPVTSDNDNDNNDKADAAASKPETPAEQQFAIQNFLLGEIPTDCMSHEKVAQQDGIAHWRNDHKKQKHYDEQVFDCGAGRAEDYKYSTPTRAKIDQKGK